MAESSTTSFCFSPQLFHDPTFNQDEFLETMLQTQSLESVHDDLGIYLEELQTRLVSLINRDYVQFLQLSSKLTGIEPYILSLKERFSHCQGELMTLQECLAQLIGQLQSQLDAQECNQSEQWYLKSFARLEAQVGRMEELVHFQQDDALNPPTTCHLSESNRNSYTDISLQIRQYRRRPHADTDEERCARFVRIAQNVDVLEFQIQQHLERANEMKDVSSVLDSSASLADRLGEVKDHLKRRLEEEFAAELTPDDIYHRQHSMNPKVLRYCFWAYEYLGETRIIGQTIAALVVEPFAEQAFSRGKLDGTGKRGSCQGLNAIYESVLHFTQHNCALFFEMPSSRPSKLDLLLNGIWRPLEEKLVSQLSSIFKPGTPSRFHRNYQTSMTFLDEIETRWCANDPRALQHFRQHPATEDFHSRWNLEIYFQVCFREIAPEWSQVQELKRTQIDRENHVEGYHFPFTACVSKQVFKCVDESQVYLPRLAQPFFRLIVQLVSGFIHFWAPTLAQLTQNKSDALVLDPLPPSMESTHEIVYLACDFGSLRHMLLTNLLPILTSKMNQTLPNDFGTRTCTQLFLPLMDQLGENALECWHGCGLLVAQECMKVLPALRTIKNQYQMTNRKPPTTCSVFVSSISQPIKVFLEQWHGSLREDLEMKKSWIVRVLDRICMRYYDLAQDMLSSAVELEQSLRSRGRPQEDHGGMSDSDKMHLQMYYDYVALGTDVSACAPDIFTSMPIESIPSYRRLLDQVQSVAPALTHETRLG